MHQPSLALETSTRVDPRPARIVACPTESARAAVAGLEPGCRVFGLTKGQFSLIDLIKAVVEQTGPAHMVLSTWTFGVKDAENVDFLQRAGDFLSVRFLVDRSFASRQPAYCARVTELFGAEAIRASRTHAKFAVLHNDRWAIVVRSSMNLNRNPRFEQFDLDDDRALADFLLAHVEEMSELMPPGPRHPTARVDDAFTRALGGGLSEVYSLDVADDDEIRPPSVGDLLGGMQVARPRKK